MTSESLWQLGPEILLLLTAVAVFVGGAFHFRVPWSWVGLAGLGMAAACLAARGAAESLPGDALGLWARWFALGMGGLFVLVSWRSAEDPGVPGRLPCLLVVVSGTMLVGAADNLILLFLGLELVSLPISILLILDRPGAAGQEAAAKHFYLSLPASAILLFGLSYLYGAAGSTSFEEIHRRLLDGSGGLAGFASLSLAFLLAGLGFKIAAVPFHFCAPDVFHGSTNENAAILSVFPKVAGFLALVRLVAVAAQGVSSDAWRVVLALAVLTMTVGSVMLLWQDNVRRLLAYSSIAHTGSMLMGLAVFLAGGTMAPGAFHGLAALLFYLLSYALATLGIFAALHVLGSSQRPIEHIDQLTGVAWSEEPRLRIVAWLLAACLFSLAGMPPLAGFWARLGLFAGALGVGGIEPEVRTWFAGLAAVGAVNAVVAAACYLRIVGTIFFRMPLGAPPSGARPPAPLTAAAVCGLLVLVIGLLPAPWYAPIDRAVPVFDSAREADQSAPAEPSDAGMIGRPLSPDT